MDLKMLSKETVFVASSLTAMAAVITVISAMNSKQPYLTAAASLAACGTGYLAYKSYNQINKSLVASKPTPATEPTVTI